MFHAARCTDAKDWIAVTSAAALTVTDAETAVLEQMLDRCEHDRSPRQQNGWGRPGR